MKRILVSVWILALSLLALTSCGGKGNGNGPEKAVKKAMECLKQKDMKGYIDTYNLSDEDKKGFVELAEKAILPELESKSDLKSYEIKNVEMNETGDTAKVNVHIVFGDGSEKDMEMDMVKVDGKWLQEMDLDK